MLLRTSPCASPPVLVAARHQAHVHGAGRVDVRDSIAPVATVQGVGTAQAIEPVITCPPVRTLAPEFAGEPVIERRAFKVLDVA